ncbi:zinc finger protein [Trichoderma cornu-damae]|uniref:Zinc finger protein n=1 Tax=Trichoderma cornu-damae TaxID=654480 RepID=A0A9P8TY33_9HYPO|nr:zinc finger protein [Trichoderma cornu-damae]
MASSTGLVVRARSPDLQSSSSPAILFPVTESTVTYSWENVSLFNDGFPDASHLFRFDKKPRGKIGKQEADCDDDCISMLSCTSACGISCPSQCGDTGQGVCCDDDACGDACDGQDLCLDETCEDAATPCTDAKCSGLAKLEQFPAGPGPGISDGDKQAAAALASIGDANLAFVHDGFEQFHSASPIEPHSCFPGSTCSHALPQGFFGMASDNGIAGQFWQYLHQENPLATHILQYHDPRHSVDHVRPCMADHPSLAIPKCTLPKAAGGDVLGHGLGHHLGDFACGFEVNTVDQFANHIFEDHWQMHMPTSQLFCLSQPSQVVDRLPPIPNRPDISSYSLNAASANEPQFSPSGSSMQNLSAGSSLSPPPTSLATTPLARPEEPPTESKSAGLAAISTQDLESVVDCACRWKMPDGKICGMQFKDANDLHAHTKNGHLKGMTRQHPGFCCHWENCTRMSLFGQKSKLERHIQTHTGCEWNRFAFPTPTPENPRSTNNDLDKPVKCTICGLQLSAKQSLDQHMRVHTGEKPWKCKFPGCPHAFKQQSALTMHERTHTGYKPLVCDICGKSFGESSNLSKHRRTHNNRGTHICLICNKDFHRFDQLRRHMHSNHKCKPEEAESIARSSRHHSN